MIQQFHFQVYKYPKALTTGTSTGTYTYVPGNIIHNGQKEQTT